MLRTLGALFWKPEAALVLDRSQNRSMSRTYPPCDSRKHRQELLAACPALTHIVVADNCILTGGIEAMHLRRIHCKFVGPPIVLTYLFAANTAASGQEVKPDLHWFLVLAGF